MELLILLIIAGVAGYFIGRYWRRKSSQPASQQVVDVPAQDVGDTDKPAV